MVGFVKGEREKNVFPDVGYSLLCMNALFSLILKQGSVREVDADKDQIESWWFRVYYFFFLFCGVSRATRYSLRSQRS